MEKLRQQIRETLESAENACVLWSGGKDSTLLLTLAREVVPDISILYFREKISPFAEQMILENDLFVHGYAPANRYLIPWNKDIALVDEMIIGGVLVPLLRDVKVSRETCQLERLSPVRTPYFDYPWETTLWGYRYSDERHPSMPAPFSADFQLGSTRMVAPLYGWSDQQILSALSELEVRYEPELADDSIAACADCLAQLDSWDREKSLSYFTNRFGFAQAKAA